MNSSVHRFPAPARSMPPPVAEVVREAVGKVLVLRTRNHFRRYQTALMWWPNLEAIVQRYAEYVLNIVPADEGTLLEVGIASLIDTAHETVRTHQSPPTQLFVDLCAALLRHAPLVHTVTIGAGDERDLRIWDPMRGPITAWWRVNGRTPAVLDPHFHEPCNLKPATTRLVVAGYVLTRRDIEALGGDIHAVTREPRDV